MEILSTVHEGRFSGSWEFIEEQKENSFQDWDIGHAHDMLSIGVTPKYTVASGLVTLIENLGLEGLIAGEVV